MLVNKICEALKTLLKRSEKHEEQLWASGFMTDKDLIELWEKPQLNGSYLNQVSALLRLNETEKRYLRSQFLKSISTLILAGLFDFDFDWKTFLGQTNSFGDRSLPVTAQTRPNMPFLRLDQLDLFAQRQYALLPYSIKEMKAAKHGDDVEPAISNQYRLPFYGAGDLLKSDGTVTVTREKIPKGCLVFKDGSTSRQVIIPRLFYIQMSML